MSTVKSVDVHCDNPNCDAVHHEEGSLPEGWCVLEARPKDIKPMHIERDFCSLSCLGVWSAQYVVDMGEINFSKTVAAPPEPGETRRPTMREEVERMRSALQKDFDPKHQPILSWLDRIVTLPD